MRLRTFSCLLLLAITFDAAASNLYTAINQLRAGEGNCALAEELPPLKPQPALERVARDVSQGGNLGQSLNQVGYRAGRASAFSIKGDSVGAHAAGMLARQGSCQELQNAAMTEVGVYLDARRVWIVLAAPFASSPSVGASGQAAGQRILDLINQARATPRYCGTTAFNAARPVRWNDLLAEGLVAACRRHGTAQLLQPQRPRWFQSVGSYRARGLQMALQRRKHRRRATECRRSSGRLD